MRERVAFDPVSGKVQEDTAAAVHAARRGGSTLSGPVREAYEQRFGADLSHVRVHTDDGADRLSRSLAADAFTVQNDVFFRRGRFAPGTTAGDRLLAHELAHVAQHGGPNTAGGELRVSSPDDHAEREAEHAAHHGPNPSLGTAAAGVVHRSPASDRKAVKVVTDQMIAQYTEGFDVALGKWLADQPQALQGGEYLLMGIHKVLARAHATKGGDEAQFLRHALGRPEDLRALPGAPDVRSLAGLAAIARSTAAGSLRTKMSLVYQAIRHDTLKKTMHSVRQASTKRTQGQTQTARDQQLKAQWGLDVKQLRGVDVSPAQPGGERQLRNYFGRQARVEGQQREVRGDVEADSLAAQEARTIGESDFVGIQLSLAELTSIAGGDGKAKTAATKKNLVWDQLSEDEQRRLMVQEYANVALPTYTPGFAVYRIGAEAAEAKEAGKRQTSLVGGLSGSTDMYLHLARYFGAGKAELELVRLAALGEMLPRRDHSFYEVVVAARGYGLTDIDPKAGPAAYGAISPIAAQTVEAGVGMALPGAYQQHATSKENRGVLHDDLKDTQAQVANYAKQLKAAGGAVPADLAERWHDYYRSTGYRWSHDAKIQSSLKTINAALGIGHGTGGLLTTKRQRSAALQILRTVQLHSGNPARVISEAQRTPGYDVLYSELGPLPANQVVAAYVEQYVGSTGMILQSVKLAADVTAAERDPAKLPSPDEIDRAGAQRYQTTIWPEAKDTIHRLAQQAESKFAAALNALDPAAQDYVAKKRALEEKWHRQAATGAVETWKRVQAQIEAIEGLTPVERYAIYFYTQGAFYNELNSALTGDRKLTKKQRAVALAASTGLRKLPVYRGPVYRAQRSGGRLRAAGVTKETLAKAAETWPVGRVIEHADFLSTFAAAHQPLDFMQTDQGKAYDLRVTIRTVKTGRWTLLLSAAEAIADGENPEHEGEVTFPPGSRFRVVAPVDTAPALAAADKSKAFVESTWDEITPDASAPPGAPLPVVDDAQVPAGVRQPPAAPAAAPPPAPGNAAPPPPPPGRAVRAKLVAAAPPAVQGAVQQLLAPPPALPQAQPAVQQAQQQPADDALPAVPADVQQELIALAEQPQ
ncbi:DUF4157 domain-containing protein [Jiangella mangrovi]|uniref:eCIS core domain-containing protein n=1 Tax=Jiangella mangrovi TaxID=1524084 RepID=A0A7W9GTM0_9ACTN|nr:DUF4157 domain-containing protein [Jiangella mangrovi]MBB5789815.1 hypothetical protein [Jiangella mangrovi]